MTRVRRITADTFRSLRSRNYRLFWSGQLVSLVGSWMQNVAIAWLVVNDLKSSASTLGIVVGFQFLPTLVGGPWAGVVADRFDKRKILILTQSAAAVLAAVLAGLELSGVIRLWMVFVVVGCIGIVTMFDNPTRQAFVTEMVGPDDLANAVGLNSAIFNMARIAGPAVAGGLIVAAGTGICFVINAVSFLAVIAGLLAMRPEQLFRGAPLARAKGQIRAGFRYARSVPELRLALGMMAVIGTLAMNFTVVLPLIAKFTFHGNAGTFGLLSAVMGLGSLVGALVAATRARPTARLLAVSALGLGVMMLASAAAPSLPVEFVLIAITGGVAITFMSTCNATLQLNSRADMRGRVMALYMVLFLGSTPIGGPIVGWIGQHAGARWSLAVGGVGSLAAGIGAVVSKARRSGVAVASRAAAAPGVPGPVGSPAPMAEPAAVGANIRSIE